MIARSQVVQWLWAMATLVSLHWSATGLRADEKEVIDELRRRVEALEKQNQHLMKLIETRLGPDGPPKVDEPNEPPPATVEKLVDDYLKKKEEKKAEEQKQKAVEGKDPVATVRWNHGIEAETADKAFKVHIGGRVQIDGAWMGANDRVQFGAGGTGRIDDAVNFRRGRLDAEGTMFRTIDFYVQYDFFNTFDAERTSPALVANTPVPTDCWVTFTQIPLVGNFRIGNQKPAIAFEHLTSSRYLNFMERSLAFDAFVEDGDNGFRPGLQVFNWTEDERATWWLGVFKNNRSVFGWNVGDGEYDLTGRLTCLPYYGDEGRYLIHLGIGASHSDLDDHQIRFRSRTEVRNGPATLHTILAEARMLGTSQDLVVPEFVVVWGPWTLQTEYYASFLNNATTPITPVAARVDRGMAFYQGYYVEVLYFLTGEHRAYDRRKAAFGRVVPITNFAYGPGMLTSGAWQVAARYSYLDLDHSGIDGGNLHDVTLGLNWFLNPNMKFQWNLSLTHRDAPGDTSDGFVRALGMRLALDF